MAEGEEMLGGGPGGGPIVDADPGTLAAAPVPAGGVRGSGGGSAAASSGSSSAREQAISPSMTAPLTAAALRSGVAEPGTSSSPVPAGSATDVTPASRATATGSSNA